MYAHLVTLEAVEESRRAVGGSRGGSDRRWACSSSAGSLYSTPGPGSRVRLGEASGKQAAELLWACSSFVRGWRWAEGAMGVVPVTLYAKLVLLTTGHIWFPAWQGRSSLQGSRFSLRSTSYHYQKNLCCTAPSKALWPSLGTAPSLLRSGDRRSSSCCSAPTSLGFSLTSHPTPDTVMV